MSCGPVQQPRLCGLTVATGAADLLVVGVERDRRVGVEHPAHVGLVDPHAERDRGRDDPRRAVQELRHRPAPRGGAQPGVVQRCPLARGHERLPRGLGARVGGGVDDPRAAELARGLRDQPLLVMARARVLDGELDVRPVEVTDHLLGVAQPEPPADLAPHRRRRGGGERDPHAHPELVGLRAEPQVVGPEVLPPLADEMRLVHDEQPRAGAPQRRARLVVGELLGRDEDELVGPARLDERRRPRTRRLRGVEHRGGQARRPQVRQLVVLQRDQRRHDDGRAVAQQAGQLVDRRLAPPVGMTASTSRPAAAAATACSWPGRSRSNPSRLRANSESSRRSRPSSTAPHEIVALW